MGCVKCILELYEGASRQTINKNKSEIVFSGDFSMERGEELANMLGVVRVDQHAIYLSIPMNVGRSRSVIFRSLVARIEKRLKDWKSKTLSQAKKLVLIKSAAQSIPTYLMSFIKNSSRYLRQDSSSHHKILVGQKNDESRMHCNRWENLCRPKTEGGIELRDLAHFNSALLAKQRWILIQNMDSLLAQTLNARYFHRNEFPETSLGHNPSYTWSSILEGRKVLKMELVWIVGNGQKINVWR